MRHQHRQMHHQRYRGCRNLCLSCKPPVDVQGQDPDVFCVPTVKRFCRSGQGHVQVPLMPNSIPAELSTWFGGASRRDARCSHEWRDCTCLGIEFQIVRRCRTSDGDHRWHVFVKVRVVVSHGYRGQRVREASHPAPVRRLRRSADVRNVFPRLATQSTVADSEVTDVVLPVRASELHVLSDTELRAPVRPSRRGGVGPRARGHSEITSRQLHPTSS